MWHGPCAPSQQNSKDSSRRHKTFVYIPKSAVRDFVRFMKSVRFTVHFGCIFFFNVKPRAFYSALFFSDLNIKAWNVITIITSPCVLIETLTIIPLALVGYEIVTANSALRACLAIYHLIFNARTWNNC